MCAYMDAEKKPNLNLSLQRKHAARIAAVQCLYSRLINPTTSPNALITWQLEQEGDDALLPVTPDKKLLQGIVIGATEMMAALEEQLQRMLGERWSGKRMPPLMRAIFIAALYELIYTPALRTSIILDQYIGVADAFLDASDISFVNGALQEITRDIRPVIPPADA
jgi:transcription antitermination protein NusB